MKTYEITFSDHIVTHKAESIVEAKAWAEGYVACACDMVDSDFTVESIEKIKVTNQEATLEQLLRGE